MREVGAPLVGALVKLLAPYAMGGIAEDQGGQEGRPFVGYFESSRSGPSADGRPETMHCHSERSEESCSASGRPSQKGQGEIPRFARNDSAFQSRRLVRHLMDCRR
jgi:hypothetical protein